MKKNTQVFIPLIKNGMELLLYNMEKKWEKKRFYGQKGIYAVWKVDSKEKKKNKQIETRRLKN